MGKEEEGKEGKGGKGPSPTYFGLKPPLLNPIR